MKRYEAGETLEGLGDGVDAIVAGIRCDGSVGIG
jgi:hypothetical protein